VGVPKGSPIFFDITRSGNLSGECYWAIAE